MDMDNDGMMAGFGALMSAMGGGGDTGNMFPQSDAEDFALGAHYIPGSVTDVRRRGEKVRFVQTGSQDDWFWEMPDGARHYHDGRKMTAKEVQEMPNVGSYTTPYDEETISQAGDTPNLTGFSSSQLLDKQESAQRAVAEQWLIAMKVNPNGDSKSALEEMGFTIVRLVEGDPIFYEVSPPEGWTKKTDGYWTTVYDADGNERFSQFYKGAIYDRDAFVNLPGT